MEYRPTERISAYEFLSWIRKPISFNAIIVSLQVSKRLPVLQYLR